MAHLAMLSVAVFYSINFFVMKAIFAANVPPRALLLIRGASGAIVFGGVALFLLRERVSRADMGRMALCALLGVVLNQFMFMEGMARTHEINGAVLMITTPVFVFLIAYFAREERITARKLLGLAMAFGGALILVTSGKGLQFSSETLAGDVLITLNAASYGAYLVLVKPLTARYSAMTIIGWMFMLSMPAILPLGWSALHTALSNDLAADVYIRLGYVIIFVTLCAYGFNAFAMRYVPSSAVGVYIYLQPILVTLFTAWWGTGWLPLPKLLCIATVIGGVVLVTWRSKEPISQKEISSK